MQKIFIILQVDLREQYKKTKAVHDPFNKSV